VETASAGNPIRCSKPSNYWAVDAIADFNDPEHWRQQADEAPRSWKQAEGLASFFTHCKPLALIIAQIELSRHSIASKDQDDFSTCWSARWRDDVRLVHQREHGHALQLTEWKKHEMF
jgi:hypothetical protein